MPAITLHGVRDGLFVAPDQLSPVRRNDAPLQGVCDHPAMPVIRPQGVVHPAQCVEIDGVVRAELAALDVIDVTLFERDRVLPSRVLTPPVPPPYPLARADPDQAQPCRSF